ncbi:thiol-disulfide isomerase [Niastella vici]|uniref:Thiol-disulfide isomerase n=1 Tax=Niastella vici TaxID=1703345 RepID=A0A1V9FWD8_9BACT|nr:thioredoxin family protein [Niastella vici]OQP62665.1 thiol-disulfide isomerase [Niastella vici]
MTLPALLLIVTKVLFPGWGTDFDKARETAKQEHKYILLNFSGSDWCGPCIRMHEEIFGSQAFKEVAGKDLVLMNADFPRLKKNQLPKDQQEQNEHLADVYNTKGDFPLTVLLSADGKVIKQWVGFPGKGAGQFVSEIKAACQAGN